MNANRLASVRRAEQLLSTCEPIRCKQAVLLAVAVLVACDDRRLRQRSVDVIDAVYELALNSRTEDWSQWDDCLMLARAAHGRWHA